MISPRPLAVPRQGHTYSAVRACPTLVQAIGKNADKLKSIEFKGLKKIGPSGPGGPSTSHPNARMRAYVRIYNISDFSFLKNTPDHMDPALSTGRLRLDQGLDHPGFTRATLKILKILKGGRFMSSALSKLEEKYGAPVAPAQPVARRRAIEPQSAWKESEPVARLFDFLKVHRDLGISPYQTRDHWPGLRWGKKPISEDTVLKGLDLMNEARRDLEILLMEGELFFPVIECLTRDDFKRSATHGN